MSENGKIRFPLSGNPSLPPPVGSYYVWLDTSGFFKKMDSAGNVTNLSVQSVNDMTDVDLTGLQDGQVLAWDEAAQLWKPVDMTGGGGGGASDFLDLTDTPANYIGMSGKVATVNQAENGLEFTDKVAGASLTGARYKYQTATTDTNGAGAVRFNNSDPSLATQIYFNRVDLDGNDLSEFFSAFIDDSYSVFLQSESDRGSAIKVKILGAGTLGGGQLGGQFQTWIFDCEYTKGTSIPLVNETNCTTVFIHREPIPDDTYVESVNGQQGVVVLDADDIDDSTTTHKFATEAQLNQIVANTTAISTNVGDIASLETELGNAENQINTNSANITALQGQMTDAQQDIIDIENQIAGGIGKTYTGVEAIEVDNTNDQVSLKLTEDSSGLYDNVQIAGFPTTTYNLGYEAVKRNGERVKVDLDLEGSNIVLNFDTGNYQIYRNTLYGDRFIGYCNEIGYWILVQLSNAHPLNAATNSSLTLAVDSWVQLGTGSTTLSNGALVPNSSYLSYSGFAINDSYLTQSVGGLKSEVVSNLANAEQYKLADSLAIKQYVDANSGGGGSGMAVAERTITSLNTSPLTANTIYLVYPSESNSSFNTLTLPAGSDGDKISILDANYLFDTYPVTISGAIDGFTGLNLDMEHCWVDFIYSATDSEWKTKDALYGPAGSGGGGAPDIVELDLSVVSNPTLQKNKIYLMRPDETTPGNNSVNLPAGSAGCSILIIDADSKFGQHPVTVNGNVDGYTGINMNVQHTWLNFLYSMDDAEFKTQDPYAGAGTTSFFTAPNGSVFQIQVDNNGFLSTQQI